MASVNATTTRGLRRENSVIFIEFARSAFEARAQSRQPAVEAALRRIRREEWARSRPISVDTNIARGPLGGVVQGSGRQGSQAADQRGEVVIREPRQTGEEAAKHVASQARHDALAL